MANKRRKLKFEDFEIQFQQENGNPLNIFKTSGFKRKTPNQWQHDDLYLETPNVAYLIVDGDKIPNNVALSINGELQTETRIKLKGSNEIKIRVADANGGFEYHVNIHVVKAQIQHLQKRPKQISYNEEDDCFFFEEIFWLWFWLGGEYYNDPSFYDEEMMWEPHDEWIGEFEEFQNFDESPPTEEPEFVFQELQEEVKQEEAQESPQGEEEIRYEAEAEEIRYEPPTESYVAPEPETKSWGGGYDTGSSDSGGGGYDSGGCDSGGGGCDSGGCD